MLVALDTDASSQRLHHESCRKLGNAGRFRLALELSDLTHTFAVAGIRRRNPAYTDHDARRELAERLYAHVGTAAAT